MLNNILNHYPDHKLIITGEIGDNQLEPLNNVLSNPATSGMIKILVFHHHPFIHNILLWN